jgi:hypothetical protein
MSIKQISIARNIIALIMSVRPKILFLPGVFLKDCPRPEDESSEEIIELDADLDSLATDITALEAVVVKTRPSIKKYDVIPTQFTSRDTWPKSTNLLCWYCSRSFEEFPWTVPISCSKNLISDDSDITDVSDTSLLESANTFREALVMDVHGNFCGCSCSLTYIKRIYDPTIINRHESERLLFMFAEIMTGEKNTYIALADAPTMMQKYCGCDGKTEETYITDNLQKTNKYISAIEKSVISNVTIKSVHKQ